MLPIRWACGAAAWHASQHVILAAAIHGLDDGDAQNSSANESYGREIRRTRRSRAEGRNELRPVAIESQPRRRRPAQMRTVLQLPRPVGHDLGQLAMTLAAIFCAGSPSYGDAQEMHRVRQRGKKQFWCSCKVLMPGIHIKPGSSRQAAARTS